MAYRLGVDVGGTFTDLFLVSEESGSAQFRVKTPSTPSDPSEGVINGVARICEEAGIQVSELRNILHGTTVATNALLEHKGARTALVTTRGFRDLLEIRRQKRPALYDLFFEKPPPLVPRHLRLEVLERVGADGEIVRPLDEDGARDAVRRLVAAGVGVALIPSLALVSERPGVVIRSISGKPPVRKILAATLANGYRSPAVEEMLEILKLTAAEYGPTRADLAVAS